MFYARLMHYSNSCFNGVSESQKGRVRFRGVEEYRVPCLIREGDFGENAVYSLSYQERCYFVASCVHGNFGGGRGARAEYGSVI